MLEEATIIRGREACGEMVEEAIVTGGEEAMEGRLAGKSERFEEEYTRAGEYI
jgi:hypothetical protein